MKNSVKETLGSGLVMAGAVIALSFSATTARAHTTEICWTESGGETTFYAATYHSTGFPVGGLIVDGITYPFTGVIAPDALPEDAQCYGCANVPISTHHYQTVTASFGGGSHTLAPTETSAVEWPWCSFPDQEFGCGDDDGDGVCLEDDYCPDTAAGGDWVPTVDLGVNRWADVDGDGEFDTTLPMGVGPERSYSISDSHGCSCSQIIEECGYGAGHVTFGCSISVMDAWVDQVQVEGLPEGCH